MRLERMTGWQDPRFEALWELYEASFPAYENRTLPDQKRAMEDERYHVDLIYEEDQWQGFVMYWQAPGYFYVEHFAVFPCGRGKGYGSKVLTSLKEKGQPVLLEIDPPEEEISIRRKGFYERNGFCANPYDYQHIPYKKDDVPHPLVVMTWPEPISEEIYQGFRRFMRDVVMEYSEAKENNNWKNILKFN